MYTFNKYSFWRGMAENQLRVRIIFTERYLKKWKSILCCRTRKRKNGKSSRSLLKAFETWNISKWPKRTQDLKQTAAENVLIILQSSHFMHKQAAKWEWVKLRSLDK